MSYQIRFLKNNTIILGIEGRHYRYETYSQADSAIDSICKDRSDVVREDFKIEPFNQYDSENQFQIENLRAMLICAKQYAFTHVN